MKGYIKITLFVKRSIQVLGHLKHALEQVFMHVEGWVGGLSRHTDNQTDKKKRIVMNAAAAVEMRTVLIFQLPKLETIDHKLLS